MLAKKTVFESRAVKSFSSAYLTEQGSNCEKFIRFILLVEGYVSLVLQKDDLYLVQMDSNKLNGCLH